MNDPKENKKPVILPENPLYDSVFEKMLKDFSRKVEKSGVLRELRERRYYTKESAIKHKIMASIKRKRKLARRRKK